MKYSLIIFSLFVFSISVNRLSAQSNTPEDYIDKYKLVAIQHRFEFKIPASITLAQGLLESGFGNSKLALSANNHFGIKCHNDWTGKRIYKDDDAKDECFRVYDKAEDSYRDHALFLTTKSRYAFLFEYKTTDYKAWAKGLKKAGYATNPEYPKRLIDIIEKYDLTQYDKVSEKEYEQMMLTSGQSLILPKVQDTVPVAVAPPSHRKSVAKGEHTILYRNRIKYIIVQEGESVIDIARQFNVSPKRIYRYNDMEFGKPLNNGMILYLQPKRKKGNAKYHLVLKGETLWVISQIHGIRLTSLRKYNNLPENVGLKAGQKLNLKKSK